MTYRGYRTLAREWGQRGMALEGKRGYEGRVDSARREHAIWRAYAARAKNTFNAVLSPETVPLGPEEDFL